MASRSTPALHAVLKSGIHFDVGTLIISIATISLYVMIRGGIRPEMVGTRFLPRLDAPPSLPLVCPGDTGNRPTGSVSWVPLLVMRYFHGGYRVARDGLGPLISITLRPDSRNASTTATGPRL